MPADCMVRWEYVGWLGEVSMAFDFRFIIITTFLHSMEALKLSHHRAQTFGHRKPWTTNNCKNQNVVQELLLAVSRTAEREANVTAELTWMTSRGLYIHIRVSPTFHVMGGVCIGMLCMVPSNFEIP